MKLVVLGSGSAVPHARRSSAAFWLECESGTMMLDLSASAPLRMAQEGLDWGSLDAVWLSHFHLDHCCGLPAFLFGTRNAPETRERTKPLKIFGPVGTQRLIENFDQVNGYKLFKQHFPIEITEVEPLEHFEIMPGLSAIAHKTPHTPESLAIRIEDADARGLVYTSDTGFAKELAAFAERVDFYITESSYFKDKPVDKHLELAEAMYLIGRAKPKRAMITHFYAEWDEVDFAKEVGRFDPGCEVIEAVDGLRLDLSE